MAVVPIRSRRVMHQAKTLRDLAQAIEDDPESRIDFILLVSSPENIRIVKPETMSDHDLVMTLMQATVDLSEKLD